jgi:hypothetical protein
MVFTKNTYSHKYQMETRICTWIVVLGPLGYAEPISTEGGPLGTQLQTIHVNLGADCRNCSSAWPTGHSHFAMEDGCPSVWGIDKTVFRSVVWGIHWMTRSTADCLSKPHNAACVLCLSQTEAALGTCPVAISLWEILTTAPTINMPFLETWLVSRNSPSPRLKQKSSIALVQLSLTKIHVRIIEEACLPCWVYFLLPPFTFNRRRHELSKSHRFKGNIWGRWQLLDFG